MAKLPSKAFKIGPADLGWTFINGDGALNDLGDIPKYEYKSTAVMTKAQAKPYIEQLDAFWLEYNGGKDTDAKSLGYKPETKKNDAGKKIETGNIEFTLKTNTEFKQKDGSTKPTTVRVFRGNGAEITKEFNEAERKTGNGSVGILHGTMAIYDRNAAARGITLYLSAVQFTKFVEYAGSVDVESVDTDEDDGLGGGGEDGLDVTPEQMPDV